uniref:Polar amino acid transport system substrate-binding protein n=2 Tax=Tetraselmis sp. GSL018 TaxID=582737 RepID=A0A061S614_9CHLO
MNFPEFNFVSSIVSVLLTSTYLSANAFPQQQLRVCFSLYAPFVFQISNRSQEEILGVPLSFGEVAQNFAGYDIELLQAISLELLQNLTNTTSFYLYGSDVECQYRVRINDCQLGIGAYAKTAARSSCGKDCKLALSPEEASNRNICCLSFSEWYVRDGYSVVTRTSISDKDLLTSIRENFTLATLSTFCVLVLLLYVSGHLIWLLERKSNPDQFPWRYHEGVDDGLWWSIVTMTTVGYGDRVPVTMIGRFLGVMWMIIGLVAFGVYNGIISSTLTSLNIEGTINPNIVSSVSAYVDSPQYHPICTVQGIWTEYLTEQGIEEDDLVVAPSIEDCYRQLNRSQVNSVFYDRLGHVMHSENELYHLIMPSNIGPAPLTAIDPGVTINTIFQTVRYAIALPLNSPMKPMVDELLKQIADGKTVFDSSLERFQNGWTEGSATRMYLIDSSKFSPLYIEPTGLASRSGSNDTTQIVIIAVTVIVSVVYLFFQFRHSIMGLKEIKKKIGVEEQPAEVVKSRSMHNDGQEGIEILRAVNDLRHEMECMKETMTSLQWELVSLRQAR